MYQTLENIIANADQIKGKLSQTLKEEKEIALRTKMLATLELDAKIDILEEKLAKELKDYRKNISL